VNYPNWLLKLERYNDNRLNFNADELIEMAKDAWAMAYNAGAEGTMTPGGFCEKYGDQA